MANLNEIINYNTQILSDFYSKNKEFFNLKLKLLKELNLFNFKDFKIIATGHQPIFYYPNILCKNFFVSKNAKELNMLPLNIVVDTDLFEIKIPVPYKENNKYKINYFEIPNPQNLTFNQFKINLNELEKFFKKIEKSLKTLKIESVTNNFKNYYRNFLKFYKKNENFVDTITQLRKDFEKNIGINLIDIKVSKISKTFAFYKFFFYIVKNIESFSEIYNTQLKEKKFKEAKPLKIDSKNFELPFWYFENRRLNLFLQKNNKNIIFFSEKEKIIELNIEKFSEDEILNILKNRLIIFPKAITLTLFIRLFLANLFIHGTGGSRYEKIGDFIIENFFNLKNLKYIVVTGEISFPFEIDINKIENEFNHKRKILNELLYHPEKFMDDEKRNFYLNLKKELVNKLKTSNDKNERKAIHQKLKNIDIEMRNFFMRQIKSIQKELKENEEILRQKKVFVEKSYPYFIYPLEMDWEKIFSEKSIIFY